MDDFLRRLAPRPSDYGGLPGKITREDDAGNVYDETGRRIFNKFDSVDQPDSWLDTAVSTATAPAKLATGLVGSLNPYGQDGWQVPPIISEPAAAFARSGELTGFGEDGQFYLPNVQNPQVAQDTLTQLMTVYGGNALNPLARVPKGAVASGAVKQAADALPMDQASRLQRARDMGFDTDTTWYHGTPRKFDAFQPGTHGAVFFSPDQNVARDYSGYTGNTVDAHLRYRNPLIVDKSKDARLPRDILADVDRSQYDAVIFENMMDRGSTQPQTQIAVFDPSNIRSTSAAFDPARAGENGLLLSDNKPSLMGSALASQPSLPMDQASRLARAAEQGYDTSNVLYRGMDTAPEDGQYRAAPGSLGDGVYLTPDPSHAAKFGDDVRENFIRGNVATANDVPPEIYQRGLLTDLLGLEGTQSSRMAEWARTNGYAGFSQPGYQTVVFDPSNIRSTNAAFDPARAGENGLLLSDNKPSLIGSALASEDEQDLLALLGYR